MTRHLAAHTGCRVPGWGWFLRLFLTPAALAAVCSVLALLTGKTARKCSVAYKTIGSNTQCLFQQQLEEVISSAAWERRVQHEYIMWKRVWGNCTYVVAFLTVGVRAVALAVGTAPSKPAGNKETADVTVLTGTDKTLYCSTGTVNIQTVNQYQFSDRIRSAVCAY